MVVPIWFVFLSTFKSSQERKQKISRVFCKQRNKNTFCSTFSVPLGGRTARGYILLLICQCVQFCSTPSSCFKLLTNFHDFYLHQRKQCEITKEDEKNLVQLLMCSFNFSVFCSTLLPAMLHAYGRKNTHSCHIFMRFQRL